MHVQHLDIAYGERVIYRDFSISFSEGETTVILGPSGCGKTTLLNYLASGAITPTVSYIFQEPRLLPWCTIEKNIVLALSGPITDKEARAREYLGKVGLEKRANEFPANLSGGERQRASIARAFANQAPVLLMDEPFQSQDPGLKKQLIALVRELQRTERRTIIAVSHDVREAVSLADRTIVLGGRPVSVILDIPVMPESEKKLTEVLSCLSPEW
jgi:NitT/TauT family transport system ATP-binding protein